MSIWSDRDIKNGLADGSIKIDPFDDEALQPASVDLRLGTKFWRFRLYTEYFAVIDTRKPVRHLMEESRLAEELKKITIPSQGFLLGHTVERVSLADNVVGRIEGKSSLARLGLSVHSTGGFIDPGNQNLSITLEIANHSPLPIILYTGMWIAQLAFENTKTKCDRPYGPERNSRYYGDAEPVPSKVDENLK